MPGVRRTPLDAVASAASDLYVAVEDFQHEATEEHRIKVLGLFQDLRTIMDAAEQYLGGSTSPPPEPEEPVLVAEKPALQSYVGPLEVGSVYTRNHLRDLFGITDATLNNGVFRLKDRPEVWLFVTENKSADREQYVDKLDGDALFWQGQKLGRTDSMIIEHRRNGDLLLLFYRTAKYQFEGAGFVFEGPFEYVSHSGGFPTSFVLRRQSPR